MDNGEMVDRNGFSIVETDHARKVAIGSAFKTVYGCLAQYADQIKDMGIDKGMVHYNGDEDLSGYSENILQGELARHRAEMQRLDGEIRENLADFHETQNMMFEDPNVGWDARDSLGQTSFRHDRYCNLMYRAQEEIENLVDALKKKENAQ